ncbi:MAG: aminotransferase class I/II-fold pyridoxal phosphate-dependent enzyme [Thermodesulfobacteriota bacterium]
MSSPVPPPKGLARHGGTIISTARELGLAPAELMDMSSNLSPLGMAPGLREHLAAALDQLGHLPEIDNKGLIEAFARHAGCKSGEVAAGNGTTDFIFALPQLLRGVQRALLVQPTYSDYEVACEQQGLAVHHFHTRPQDDFALDLDQLEAQVKDGDLVFICNPNNPTGRLLASHKLHALAAAHPGASFVVDESYLPFTREVSLVAFPKLANLYILCSSSKIYGIPGLRLGFLVAHESVLPPFAEQLRPWAINRLAQLAGEYLFSQADDHVAAVVDFVLKERPKFVARLTAGGVVQAVPGVTNFILCRFLGRNMTAGWLQAEMLQERIMVRNCANFQGLDDSYFRLSLQGRADNDFFLDRFAELMDLKG